MTLISRAVDETTGESAHLYSVGNNSLAGPIILSVGSAPDLHDTFAIGSLAGTLTVAGDLTAVTCTRAPSVGHRVTGLSAGRPRGGRPPALRPRRS